MVLSDGISNRLTTDTGLRAWYGVYDDDDEGAWLY